MRYGNAPTNTDNVIDSRDVIARIEELEEERAALEEEATSTQEAADACTDDDSEVRDALDADAHNAAAAVREWDADNDIELSALKALASEAEGCGDWDHGETLIRDSYFEDHARELAEDTGAIESSASWPLNCIDWKQAAEELQQDYTSVDFDGATYWLRS